MDNNRKEEQSEKKETKKSIRDNLIFPLIVAIVSVLLTHHFTAESVQKGVVETLSTKLDYIEATDKLEDAIAEIVERDNDAEKQATENESTISETEQENKELQKKLNNMPKVQYNSISIVKNGLKTDENINNGWATIDNRNYYSEDSVNSLLESKVHLDEETKTLFYDITGTSDPRESKITLEDSNTWYDGYNCKYYESSNADTFSLGSDSYNSGFTLNNHTWEGNSYALFHLKGNYSKMAFDVGKVAGEENFDATMRVYLDNKYSEEYDLSASVAYKHIEIELKYSDSLKIEVFTDNTSHTTVYGFSNVILEY